MELTIKEKPFTFLVDTPGILYPKKFSLDKNVVRILAIAINADYPEQLFYRGSQKIEINGLEIYEDGHESKMLMRGLAEKKYNELDNGGAFPGNGEVKISYQDTANTNTVFAPYKVTLYLRVEIK